MSNSAESDEIGKSGSAAELSATQIGHDGNHAGARQGGSGEAGLSSAALTHSADFPLRLEVGRSVNRFELEGLLGRGTFGEVWKCHDPVLNRSVAIKFARPKGDVQYEAKELVDEARKVSRLSHPGIVHIYDVLVDGPNVAIVSELIDGQTLKERLAAGPISVREVAVIVRDVAAGLQHAHQHDLVHRDVKPSNILLRKNGSATLTDFGLAASEVQLEQMISGTSGTLLFMSPEQARGDVQLLDNRSDLFCLGIVLFHCLTNKFPYPQAQNKNKYREYVAKRLAKPLRAVDRSLPKALDNICSRCLALDPSDRYRSAQDLVDDLDVFLAGDDHQPLKSKPRQAWWLPLTTATGLGAALAVGVLLTPATRTPGTPQVTADVPNSATSKSTPGIDADGKSQSPPSLLGETDRIDLVEPPKIFAWPVSDSRGIPQHTPETQTFSFRSDNTALVAVCGQTDARELNLAVEFSLRDQIGAAGIIWALRQNPDQTASIEHICYAAEFFRDSPTSLPLLIVSEIIMRPLDQQEMQISHRREIASVEIKTGASPWMMLRIRANPGHLEVFFENESVLTAGNLPLDEKPWLSPGASSVGIIGRGAMVAFRNLQQLKNEF